MNQCSCTNRHCQPKSTRLDNLLKAECMHQEEEECYQHLGYSYMHWHSNTTRLDNLLKALYKMDYLDHLSKAWGKSKIHTYKQHLSMSNLECYYTD